MDGVHFDELDQQNQDQVRALILDGLADRWAQVDPSLNPDLDDMLTSYADGRTVVVRDDAGQVVGTGTIVPRADNKAEILRMSVDRRTRNKGLGRWIVDELVATAGRWGCASVILETTTAWTDAVRFYQGCGFDITHRTDSEFGQDTWFERRLDVGAD